MIFISIFVQNRNLGSILSIFIHSLINSKSNELPQRLGCLWLFGHSWIRAWMNSDCLARNHPCVQLFLCNICQILFYWEIRSRVTNPHERLPFSIYTSPISCKNWSQFAYNKLESLLLHEQDVKGTGRLPVAVRLMNACSSFTIFPYKECNHVCRQSCGDRFRRGQTEQEIGQLLLESAFLSDIAQWLVLSRKLL